MVALFLHMGNFSQCYSRPVLFPLEFKKTQRNVIHQKESTRTATFLTAIKTFGGGGVSEAWQVWL